MYVKNSIYVTTGEFSKMTGTTKDTLFHYDDIGLFSPEIIGENGYRYYSIYQIETFEVIAMLKELGMSLKDIRCLLDKRSAAMIKDVFAGRICEIDTQIARLKSMKRWINDKIENIEYAQGKDYSAIEIIEHKPRYYIYSDNGIANDKEIYSRINEMTEKLISSSKDIYTGLNYDVAFFQDYNRLKNKIYNQYTDIALLLKGRPSKLKYKMLPQGKYLTAYHIGHWDSIGEAYERMFIYKEANGICTDDIYIEYYVVDNLTADDINKYVTEISVRIDSNCDR